MVVKRKLFENQRDLFLTTILYMEYIFLFFYLYHMYFGGQNYFSFKNQSKILTAIWKIDKKHRKMTQENRVLETKKFL